MILCNNVAINDGLYYLKRCGDLDGYIELTEYEKEMRNEVMCKNELISTYEIKEILKKELLNPSDEFVSLILKDLSDKEHIMPKGKNIKELLKKSIIEVENSFEEEDNFGVITLENTPKFVSGGQEIHTAKSKLLMHIIFDFDIDSDSKSRIKAKNFMNDFIVFIDIPERWFIKAKFRPMFSKSTITVKLPIDEVSKLCPDFEIEQCSDDATMTNIYSEAPICELENLLDCLFRAYVVEKGKV